MRTARKTIALAGLCIALLAPASAQAGFGLVPNSTTATALNDNGTIDEQASSHPGDFVIHFELNTNSSAEPEGGEARDFLVDSPAGLVGNPSAVPACSRQQLEGFSPKCPPETQVGVLGATVEGLGHIFAPIYNVVPPPGTPTMFGFSVAGRNVFQFASVQSEEGYVLRVSATDVPVTITDATETIWGVPASPSHYEERFCRPSYGGALEPPCASRLQSGTSADIIEPV